MINLPISVSNGSDAPLTHYHDIGKNHFPLFTIGGIGSYIVAGSYIRTSIEQDFNRPNYQVHNIHIGRNVSIATGTSLCVGSNHDYLSLDLGIMPSGHGATIMGGVTIHNGAVVAAGSHIVKDVPPFAIVGGNPAKVLKYRFSKNIIKKLQTIKWWNWSKEKINLNRALISSHRVEEFCEKFYPEAFRESRKALSLSPVGKLIGKKDYSLDTKSMKFSSQVESFIGKNIYLYFLDTHADFSLYKKVITSFCALARGGVLVLVADGETSEELEQLNSLVEQNLKNEKLQVFLVENLEDERALMSCVDFYIPNRDPRTIYRSELADDYNVQILSAVDHNIFG